ncbi:hypothetical protein [Lyngbya aestuarii]|uniref:hypothetical protein n=1 Tax=Lyngbya aestuarii TaxID=118322 RepID=UPI00403D997A
MAPTPQRQSNLNIQAKVDQILSEGQLARPEYLQMTTAILSDYNVTDEERRQINRIFDDVQAGRVKLVD